jgi:hypothetical protein
VTQQVGSLPGTCRVKPTELSAAVQAAPLKSCGKSAMQPGAGDMVFCTAQLCGPFRPEGTAAVWFGGGAAWFGGAGAAWFGGGAAVWFGGGAAVWFGGGGAVWFGGGGAA